MYIHIWHCFFLFVGIYDKFKSCSYVSTNNHQHMHACIAYILRTFIHTLYVHTQIYAYRYVYVYIHKYIYIYNCLYIFVFMHANKFTLNFVRITIGARCTQKTARSQAQTPHEKIQLEMSSEPKHPKKTRTMQLIWGCEVLLPLSVRVTRRSDGHVSDVVT